MLMSTTALIEGRPVSRYHGIVTGEAIIGANVFRDLFARVRDIVGGRSATYESRSHYLIARWLLELHQMSRGTCRFCSTRK
jgi:uncharacterized protein YbjQ (UPF0145 family)